MITEGNPRQIIHSFLSPFKANGSPKETGGLCMFQGLAAKWIRWQIAEHGGYISNQQVHRLVVDDETGEHRFQLEVRTIEDMIQDCLYLALRALDKRLPGLPDTMPVSEVRTMLIFAIIQSAKQVGHGRTATQTERTACSVPLTLGDMATESADMSKRGSSDDYVEESQLAKFRGWCANYQLTPREIDVAVGLATGQSQSDIGRGLSLHRNTIATNYKRAESKLESARDTHLADRLISWFSDAIDDYEDR